MSVNSNLSVAEIVTKYRLEYEKDPSRADRSLLERGKAILYEEVEASSWASEIIHSGHALLHGLGDKQSIVDLMRSYLLQPISTEEEAWARWHLVDNLAMLRQRKEAVDTQKDYLTWALKILPCPDWWLTPAWPWDFGHNWRPSRKNTLADECLLFRIWYDGTQSRCWIEIDKADEWFDIFKDLMDRVPATPHNRVDRRYLLRTAARLLTHAQRPKEALSEAQKLEELGKEDPNWPESFETQIDAKIEQLEACWILNDMSTLRETAKSITELLEDRDQPLSDLTSEKKKTLRTMYHNSAAPLYRAKQYDLAIPLFQRAIELEIPSEHSYLWLAASIWATKQNRSDVLSLIRKGVFYSRVGQYSGKIPEFSDVANDVEFIEAMKRP